jgi:hypothetical protein
MFAYLQTDADFSSSVKGMPACVLYLEDGGEVSSHDSFVLLDPLRRQADPGGARQLNLAPAQM